nr:MAG TPA: hypothetical protein [Caudoviricetes sp.]
MLFPLIFIKLRYYCSFYSNLNILNTYERNL